MRKIRKVLLDAACAEENCLEIEDQRERSEWIERQGTDSGESRWLDLFCPEQACEITSPSELP